MRILTLNIILVVSGLCACGQSNEQVSPTPAPASDVAAALDNGEDSEVDESNVHEGPLPKNALVTLEVNGVDRQYRLYVPNVHPPEGLPLLVLVHGGSGRSEPFPQESRFHQLAETESVIIAHPLAELLPGNEGEWQLNTAPDSRQDIEFMGAMIDQIATHYVVDAKRIYASGYSLGSMFTYELACHASDRFAAIASHAGTMPVSPNSCEPDPNVAVMHIHGRDDWIISYDDTWDWKSWDEVGTMMNIPGLVAYWSDKYNCQGSGQSTAGSSTHQVHESCDDGVRVEHHALTGVGHEWPESIDGISTHQVIWSFVSGFSKP